MNLFHYASVAALHVSILLIAWSRTPSLSRTLAWYRLTCHCCTFAAGAFIVISWGRMGRYGFFKAQDCVVTSGPLPQTDAVLAFETAYCIVDICAHAATRERMPTDMIAHHALTAGIIFSGEARVHAALTMHFLAVCGPASIALLAKSLPDTSRRSVVVFLDCFFALSFVWARAVLLPHAFINQLLRCHTWGLLGGTLHGSLLLLGAYWCGRLGMSVHRKIRKCFQKK
jgi:TLC domain